MAFTIAQARQLVAKSRRGGENDADIQADALDALGMAMQKLNYHDWEFNLTAASLTASAATADYTVPTNLLKIYDVLWGTSWTLRYVEQRIDDRVRPNKSPGTPTHYSLFPQGSLTKMRLHPAPAEAGTIVTLNYYKKTTIPTATAMATPASASASQQLDIPLDYRYWPIFEAKAIMLGDRNAPPVRIKFWQDKADVLWAEMKRFDQYHPDDPMSFKPRSLSRGTLGADHAWNAVRDQYGF